MSAHLPTRASAGRSALYPAMLALLAAAVIAGGGCLWAVLTAPAGAVMYVAWTGGTAAAVTCAAVTITAYYVGIARRGRNQIVSAQASAGQLERDLSRLLDETLPAVVKRLREGESAEQVLRGVPALSTAPLQRLVQTVAQEVGAAEGRRAAANALHVTVENDVVRLAGEALPELVTRLRAGESADAALAAVPSPGSDELQQVLRSMAREIEASERRGAAAMAASASAAARVQAQTTRALAELRELEHRFSEDDVFADLLELDHRISQMGRLADGIALLSGGRSGRRWTKPIVIESILRGAMGRIESYRRVRLHNVGTFAVAGYAAEGVMHALAELMDNAAAFSSHGSEVHVYVEEEDAGAVVTIEDSGLGMGKRERHRAETVVSEALNLTTLTGTRLGLAVVGRLASRYGLSISFRPSSRGGTGVVVLIPRQLIVQVRDHTQVPAAVPVLADAAARPAVRSVTDGAVRFGDEDPETGGMPKRPRGQTLAAASRRAAVAEATAPRGDMGARFAAFHQAGGDRSGQSAQGEPETEPR
jgi:signal transduction histidine kinase